MEFDWGFKMTSIQLIHPDDIFLWEDGNWSHQKHLSGVEGMDISTATILPRGSLEWTCLVHESDVQEKNNVPD